MIHWCDFRARRDISDDPDALYRFAHALPDGSQAARSALWRVVDLDPEHTEAWIDLGYHYSVGGDNRTAAALWRHALHIDPDNACARHNLDYVSNMATI